MDVDGGTTYLIGYDTNSSWANYTATSEDNPLVKREWLDDMRQQASNRIWRQEYLAEFETRRRRGIRGFR